MSVEAIKSITEFTAFYHFMLFLFFVVSLGLFHLFVVQNVRLKNDLGFLSVMLSSGLERHFGKNLCSSLPKVSKRGYIFSLSNSSSSILS